MNLLSALKKFNKVTKKEWMDAWGWNEFMYVSYNAEAMHLYLHDDSSSDGCRYDYEYEEELMANDWIEFPECPACRIDHECGKEN